MPALKIKTANNKKEYKTMSSPFNDDNKGFEKEKKQKNNKKMNRTTILTVVTLAIAVIIVATAAIISNRTKEPTKLPSPNSTERPSESQQTETPTEAPTEAPTDKPTVSTPAGNKLPSFILPVSGVLSSTHNPDLQVYSPTMNDYRVHLGIDLVTKDRAPVYSAADGKVAKIWVDPMMGYCMAISHSGNCVTVYKNLAEDLAEGIAEGVSVRAGQIIGSVGESAMVEVGSEPHLHFEMTVSDLAVDPLKYFDENTLETIKADSTHE